MRPLVLALLLCACQAKSIGDTRGRVVIDGADDHSGVTVRAVGPITATAETNADGDYQLWGLPPGEYALWLAAADTLEETHLEVAQIAAGESTLPEIHFTAVGAIDGLVHLADGAGGGAVVFVEGASALATSDGSGRYHIEKVPAGMRSVEAVLSGYRPGKLAPVRVTRGEITEAPPLSLDADDSAPYPVASLAGIAERLNGDDHSGTTVTAIRGTTRLTTTTAKDGSYRFDGIPTGLYRLEFDYEGRSEEIPQVVALAGSTGQVVDGALHPLETNTLKLPEARRVAHDLGFHKILDAQRLLVSQAGGLDRNDQTLSILDLATGNRTTVVSDSNRSSGLVVGKALDRILYLAGVDSYQGALRTVSLAGGTPVTLAPLVDGNYRFSLDEAWVLFTVQGQLRSVPITGGGSEITLGTAVSDQGTFHPDGKRVIFQTCDPTCRLYARSLDGGPLVEISQGTGPTQLSPDGSHVLSVVQHDYNTAIGQLRLAKVDGSASRIVWDGKFSPYYLYFSPDSQHAAFLTDGDTLRILPIAGDAMVAASKVGTFNFTSDGSRLLYLADYEMGPRTWTLKQQPAAGGAEMVLGDRVEQFVVSPDGTRTLFLDELNAATRGGRLQMADAAGQLTTLAADAMPPVRFGPDSKRVFYYTLHPTRVDVMRMWTLPVMGGTPVQLGDSLSWTSVDSPGGVNLAWTGDDGMVRVMPAAGGTARAVAPGYVSWINDTRLLLTVTGAAAPFRHQNGLYLYDVTP